MKQPVVLRVYKGDKLETVRQFEHSQIVIGRNSDVQLELQDEGVALLHAMIEERGQDYYISDLGSQTGTFKGGARLLEDRLNSGDEIVIGPFRIQFYIGVPKPATPPKPAAAPTPVEVPAAVAVTFTSPTPAAPVELPTETPPETKSKSVATPVNIPSARKFVGATAAQEKKSHKTFAPVSPYKDLKEIVKPQKGSMVEVIVAWNDRILSTNHFNHKGSVFLSSSEDADVVVPIISSKSKYELLKIGANVTICLTPEMTGELVRDGETLSFAELGRQNKMRNAGSHFELELRQGEMVRIGLQNDLISIYVRYAAESPKPLVAPLLDMSSSEVTGVIMALAVSAILGLYMNIYTPSPLLEDEAKIEEPIRKAVVTFTPPPPREEPKTEPPPEPPKKKVVEVKDTKTTAQTKAQPAQSKAFENKPDPGKAAEVRPKPNSQNQPKKPTSAVPQGAAVKTGNKEGANMKSEKPDPNKMGLLATFGKGGVQKDLSKAYSGSGELAGMADQATGAAGSSENRAGDTLGGKLKDTGAGGKGTATYGIAGVGTQGRGTGTTGYGTGGLGQKGSVQINVGGQDADFGAGMDREAIRRVIREHIREIRNCYERELQRSPDLYGKVVLEWDIEEEGRVSRVVTKSNALGNDNVANCIMSRLKTWKFPDPPKDQIGRVSYPFVFSSQ
ncbi:MAG TPA: AgmX/PglI C-terminal domain-containing protein [Bdellovibrionales bacterium]|nr:AgmX/PglI C-terminal domain-containing protein [Bdellovibrionales bacterium]